MGPHLKKDYMKRKCEIAEMNSTGNPWALGSRKLSKFPHQEKQKETKFQPSRKWTPKWDHGITKMLKFYLKSFELNIKFFTINICHFSNILFKYFKVSNFLQKFGEKFKKIKNFAFVWFSLAKLSKSETKSQRQPAIFKKIFRFQFSEVNLNKNYGNWMASW